MTSTASSILDYGSDSGKVVRRWSSKTQTPPSKVSMMDRTSATRSRSNYTLSTNGSTPSAGLTTFLPEMHSTPPMPTFQKPAMGTPLRRERYDENMTPSRSQISRRPDTPFDEPSMSGSTHRSSFSRPQLPYTTMPPADRVSETPPLPKGWSRQQDRAICILDASNYSLPAIVQKIRRVFPEIHGTLTPAMVDKRLRQLDQIVELDYWAIGLAKTEKQQRKDKAKIAVPDNWRLDSSNTLLPAGNGGGEQKDVGRTTAISTPKQRSQSLGNTDGARPNSHPADRNLVTRGFLTGFRSQFL
ncbi:hypothetical protein Slin15195_G026570 [Septoria linicola]|uniref:Uncharacterized protein n=1 Tax=Septoria linicola TaxID=215465 RepID=A0A9Q9EHI4_9PEZI|nr:hypothetical protein Slin14017_G025630 [Septoria linicola]USW49338.1 hypothetical protein Slin15195_G026570 [Septoria linicola]